MRRVSILLALTALFPSSSLVSQITVSSGTALSPDDPKFYLQRAATELTAKDYAGAEKDARKAMDMGYRKTSALNTRSAALTGLGRFKEAYADADLAVQVNETGATGYLNRAAAREGLGQKPEEILADFQKAAELDKRWRSVYESAKKRYGASEPTVRSQPAPKAPAPPVVVAKEPVPPKVEEVKEVKMEEPKPEPALAPARAPAPAPVPASNPIPWKNAAGGAAAVVLLGLLIVKGLGRHRARRVRFGSVMSVPMPSVEEPSIGSVLGGRYILGKATGQEDAVDIFEARDLEDRPRVLRRLRRRDPGLLQKAKTAGGLKHASILPLEAVFEQAGHVYLASEPAAGEPMRRALDRLPDHRYSPSSALAVLQGICEALDFAHGKGVFHGHLTPSHVLVEKAKVQVKGFALPPETAENDYLPPEHGTGEPNAEGDVFALGACLYEMLTGGRPFKGPEAGQNKREGKFPSATGVVKSLPDGIDDLLGRALSADPARRFHAAGELFAALRALVIPGVH
jgi:tetratricopeptide (TPR) repeat protein